MRYIIWEWIFLALLIQIELYAQPDFICICENKSTIIPKICQPMLKNNISSFYIIVLNTQCTCFSILQVCPYPQKRKPFPSGPLKYAPHFFYVRNRPPKVFLSKPSGCYQGSENTPLHIMRKPFGLLKYSQKTDHSSRLFSDVNRKRNDRTVRSTKTIREFQSN